MSAKPSVNNKAFDYYPPLKKVRKHFEANYSKQLSLSDAAKIAGLESKHFSKFFRNKVGIGFKQWTTLVRVRKAMRAIRNENQSITEIAFAVGFQDVRTFERAFKAHSGLTAREYKASVIAQFEQSA